MRPRVGAAVLHGVDGPADGPGRGAAPAGVDGGQDAGLRVDERQREAVGHQDGQRDLGRRRHEDVGVGDGVVL